MIDMIVEIILKYSDLDRDRAERIARKVALNPCSYDYVLDVLEHYFLPFNAKLIAAEVYEKCLGMRSYT
jgi:hypothetical protein